MSLSDSFAGQWVLWVLYLLAFAYAALLVTGIVSPKAAGSGLPQMKALLSGVYLPHYLNGRTLVAKVIGLSCFLGSGTALFMASTRQRNPLSQECSLERRGHSFIYVRDRVRRGCSIEMSLLIAPSDGDV